MTDEVQDWLVEASLLIQKAANTLDESEESCPSCHMKIKHNWPEAKAAKWLRGLPKKLMQVCDDLKGFD